MVQNKKIEANNLHGTGCTLSSAIVSFLTLGYSLEDSIFKAKEYLTKCLDILLNWEKDFALLIIVIKY